MDEKNHDNVVQYRLIEENHELRKENMEIKTKYTELKKCVKSIAKIIQRLVPLLALLDENVAKMNVENTLVNKILNVLDLGPQSQNVFKKRRVKSQTMQLLEIVEYGQGIKNERVVGSR